MAEQLKFSGSSIEKENDWQNETVDDVPMRKTKLLSDVYERCNVDVCEPTDYAEAKEDKSWMVAMEEELSMMEENKNSILVDRRQGRKVIG